ncbi:class I SAM-dependent methyltransferase [Victivallis lenta]|uniref:class I SAM-dependent methyltransferase n=1 Tax=Victivallis lenta TaxID=2606640 RepID=UPI003AF27844
MGIDPEPEIRHELTANTTVFPEKSDDFFAARKKEDVLGNGVIDLAFIDGMHLFESVLDDFIHVERWAGPHTIVLIHDTVPADALSVKRERQTRFWTGDVYKFVLCLKEFRPDLKIYNLNIGPSGLCFVGNLNPASTVLSDRRSEIVNRFMDIEYSTIAPNRDSLLCIRENSNEELSRFLAGILGRPTQEFQAQMQTLRHDVQKEFSGKLQAECEKSAETIRELQAALKKHRETIVRRDQALLQFNETKQALEKWRAECVRQKELLAALRDTVSRRDASLEKLKLERETTVRKTEHLQQLLAEQKSVIDRRETEYRQQKELLAALRDTVSRRDASLEKLKLEREALVQKTECMHRLLEERNSVIDKRNAEIAAGKMEIEKCRTAVIWRDEALEKQKRRIEELSISLEKHRAAIDKRDAALVKHKAVIAKRDEALLRHQAAIAKRDGWLAQNRRIIDDKCVELRLLTEQLMQIRNSRSYRAGQCITYFPRKLRIVWRKFRNRQKKQIAL